MEKWLLILLMIPFSLGAVFNADSCSRADVQAAIDLADYGDTVKIPSGDCTWSTGVKFSKDLTIEGQLTTLRAGFIADSNSDGKHDSNDEGAFFEFVPDTFAANRIASLNSEGLLDISGIEFNGQSRMKYKYGIWISHYSSLVKRIRIHNNIFNNVHRAVQTDGNIYGVFYENDLVNTNAAYPSAHNENTWDNYPANLGSGDGWYIEDNTLSFSGVGTVSGGGHGMSHVVRYNDITGEHNIYVESHGNQKSGVKGTQITEVYGNSFTSTASQGFDMRGGKALIFFNKMNDDSIQVREEYSDSLSGTPIDDACPLNSPQLCLDTCKCMKIHDTYIFNNRRLNGALEHAFIRHDWYDTNIVNSPLELVENREFWNHDTSFNGEKGLGCGSLASRPTTCTKGVGYWATGQDCSKIDDKNIGQYPSQPISGTLYRCVETDSWEEFYTPYAYPHPLRTNPVYFSINEIIEAESGMVKSPMQASNGIVFTTSRNSGSVSFSFNVSKGEYVLEAYVNNHNDAGRNSFYFGVDDEPAEANEDYAYGIDLQPDFHWDQVSRTDDPYVFSLEGVHTLTLYGREVNTYLDKIKLVPYACDSFTLAELIGVMDSWKTGTKNINDVMQSIKQWKNGC